MNCKGIICLRSPIQMSINVSSTFFQARFHILSLCDFYERCDSAKSFVRSTRVLQKEIVAALVFHSLSPFSLLSLWIHLSSPRAIFLFLSLSLLLPAPTWRKDRAAGTKCLILTEYDNTLSTFSHFLNCLIFGSHYGEDYILRHETSTLEVSFQETRLE